MIDHFEFRVKNFAACVAFYETVLPTIGMKLAWKGKTEAGFCHKDTPHITTMLISEGSPSTHIHLCFTATSTAEVDAFHSAAIAAGYRCNGKPGPRPDFESKKGEGYYAAFVFDPSDNNIEALFRYDKAKL